MAKKIRNYEKGIMAPRGTDSRLSPGTVNIGATINRHEHKDWTSNARDRFSSTNVGLKGSGSATRLGFTNSEYQNRNLHTPKNFTRVYD